MLIYFCDFYSFVKYIIYVLMFLSNVYVYYNICILYYVYVYIAKREKPDFTVILLFNSLK